MPELEITVLESLLRMAPKKPGLFSDIDQKGILQKSLLLEALEIVTCHCLKRMSLFQNRLLGLYFTLLRRPPLSLIKDSETATW